MLNKKSFWIIKQEPSKYNWQQFEKDKGTYWDGVRNYQARNNLKNMKNYLNTLMGHKYDLCIMEYTKNISYDIKEFSLILFDILYLYIIYIDFGDDYKSYF